MIVVDKELRRNIKDQAAKQGYSTMVEYLRAKVHEDNEADPQALLIPGKATSDRNIPVNKRAAINRFAADVLSMTLGLPYVVIADLSLGELHQVQDNIADTLDEMEKISIQKVRDEFAKLRQGRLIDETNSELQES
jgi:hypothetical protein